MLLGERFGTGPVESKREIHVVLRGHNQPIFFSRRMSPKVRSVGQLDSKTKSTNGKECNEGSLATAIIRERKAMGNTLYFSSSLKRWFKVTVRSTATTPDVND